MCCMIHVEWFLCGHGVWYNSIFSITIFYTSVAISFNRFYALRKTVIIGRMKGGFTGGVSGIIIKSRDIIGPVF